VSDLLIMWGPVRALLQENFKFSEIKQIIALAGIDITRLSHLTQKPKGGASKENLTTCIDGLYAELDDESRRRFIKIVVEESSRRNQGLESQLDSYIARLGWRIVNGNFLPIDFLGVSELQEMPKSARSDLERAMVRLRDGDLSGAISSACGSIDSITKQLYSKYDLGDAGEASFQEKVNCSLEATKIFEKTEQDLVELGWSQDDANKLQHNLRGALNQAAYVMQTLRSRMGDVHGTRPTLKPLVYDSIKWAMLIVRLLGH